MRAISLIVEVASAVSALGAAFFWFLSARVDLPVIGSTYETIGGLESFYEASKRVATLSRQAAICAGLSALLQAASFPL